MLIASLARRYATAGWRHRWKALLLAWLICIPGWAAVYSLPSQYQASARIYADAEAILGTLLRGIAVDSSPSAQVDMLQRTLLSRPNLERVIAKTDLDLRVTDMASRERVLQQLATDIKLTPQTRQLFKIDYTDRDPRLAYAVVQTLITLFMENATGSDRQQRIRREQPEDHRPGRRHRRRRVDEEDPQGQERDDEACQGYPLFRGRR